MSPRICPDCEKTTEFDTCPECGSPTLDQTPFLKREDPLIGKLVGGRYRVQAVLGAGGMGKVYVAEQVAMKRQVALKVIRTQESGDMSQKMSLYKRFQREAMAASRLEHPNTVRVFDFGMADDGTLFLAMELLRGKTLSKLLQSGSISRRRVVRIAIQICRSLAEAHENGIVHRDLKPDNIMISDVAGEKDFVKILDFGIAKITAETGQSSITRTGMIMGTPAYMAPEQATGGAVGPATDLYALGVILYEAISGRPPFVGETPLAILIKHANEMVPRLVVDGFPPDVPEDLAQLIYDLLEKKPGLRPASAIEVARRLENIDFQKLLRGHANQTLPTLPGVPGFPAPAAVNDADGVSGVQADGVKKPEEDRVVTTVSLPTPSQGTGYMYVPTDAAKIFSPFGPDTVVAPDSGVSSGTLAPDGIRASDDASTSPAERMAQPVRRDTPASTDPEIALKPRRGRGWILGTVAILLLAGLGGAAFWAFGGAGPVGPEGAAADRPANVPATSKEPVPASAAGTPVAPASAAVAPAVEVPATGAPAAAVPAVAPVATRGVPETAKDSAKDALNVEPSGGAQVVPAVVPPAPVPESVALKAPARVKRPPTRPQLPKCVRSICPISGDCVDKDGRRVNGKSFCGELAL